VQTALAAKEKELSELQAKIQELGSKEIEMRNEKVVEMCFYANNIIRIVAAGEVNI